MCCCAYVVVRLTRRCSQKAETCENDKIVTSDAPDIISRFPMWRNYWLWAALNAMQWKYFGISMMKSLVRSRVWYDARKLDSSFVEFFAMYLASPGCGEDAVVHMVYKNVGGSVTRLASAEQVDGDAFLSWSCCQTCTANTGLFAIDRIVACVRGDIPL